MCEAASRIVLLVDSSKFGRKSPNVVCDLSVVDTLITDNGINPDYLAALQAKGINIILVGDPLMSNATALLNFARETLEIELTEAQRLLTRLDDNFVQACELLLNCRGKAVISGIGKSGHIGKKIAASLASTGTPSFFVHPAEALHGDLGMIGTDDVVIFISYSGRAKELDLILPLLAESKIPVIAMTGGKESPLALGAACTLDISVEREACPMGLAPTSSGVTTLMMGMH